MKISVIGLRGLPDIQGGVEKHAEQLYPLLAAQGFEILIFGRSPFANRRSLSIYEGICVKWIFSPAPRFKGMEAFIHTLLAIAYAAHKGTDILHIHAIGPAILTPLARLLGLRVVVTHHGFDYNREKWGKAAKWMLKTGEYMGMKFAHETIAVSQHIRDVVQKRYGSTSVVIPNGISKSSFNHRIDPALKNSLFKEKYVLMVSRFVPEKRHLDLLAAFEKARLPGWQLVLVGALEPRDPYIDKIVTFASRNRNVVLPGFQCGSSLAWLYENAGLFVLPSSHEGFPISVLEALSYGNKVLISDIAPHKEIQLDEENYFPLGNIEALVKKLKHMAKLQWTAQDRLRVRNKTEQKYSWEKIAIKTMEVYARCSKLTTAVAGGRNSILQG